MGDADRRPEDTEGSRSRSDDDRLTRLRREIDNARGTSSEPQRAESRGTQVAFAMRLATEFVASVIVGAGLGWLLDQWFNTTPLFLLILFGFGTAAGFRNMLRYAAQSQSQTDNAGGSDGPPNPGDTER